MGINDIIKDSILEAVNTGNNINMETAVKFAVYMVASLLLGILISIIYKRYSFYREGIYSRSFSTTLVGMCMMSCMVTLAISTNIVISLGMVGALSIVRYRTAIKAPVDLLYLFWAITSGITLGAGMFLLAAMGALAMILCMWVSARIEAGQPVYVYVINYGEEKAQEEITGQFRNFKWKLKSLIARPDNYEMTLQVYGYRRQEALLEVKEKILGISGVRDVAMILLDSGYQD